MKRNIENEETKLIEHKLIPSTNDRKNNPMINKIGDRLFGQFNKHNGKLLALEIPPQGQNYNIRGYFKQVHGNKYPTFTPEKIPTGDDKLMDVYNNIELYNKVYYITDKIEYTISLSVDEARKLSESKIDEWDLIKELFGEMTPRFRSIYPLYHLNMIENIQYGADVVNSINMYLKTQDRSFVDTGVREKCIELLTKCADEGFTELLGEWHPPIPTTDRFHKYNSIEFIHNIFQASVANFSTLRKIYHEWYDDYSYDEKQPPNFRVEFLKDMSSLKSTTCLPITVDHVMVGKKIEFGDGKKKDVVYITDLISFERYRKVKNYLFVFRNMTSMKQYNAFKHCVVPSITRMYSSTLFIDTVCGNKKMFYKCVSN